MEKSNWIKIIFEIQASADICLKNRFELAGGIRTRKNYIYIKLYAR